MTLTIDPLHPEYALIAPGGSLSLATHTKFMKRLRARVASELRFYMCGEYGEKLGKPHYHYLLFGFDFEDKYYFKKSESGEPLYRSNLVEQIWPYGHAWIGAVSEQSCAYVASYVMKKITGDMAYDHYRRTDNDGQDYWLMSEFNLMSRNPGVGATWWDTYRDDVIHGDKVITAGGSSHKPPRYYDKLLEKEDPEKYAANKQARVLLAKRSYPDQTPERLLTRETVAVARVSNKKRNLEKL